MSQTPTQKIATIDAKIAEVTAELRRRCRIRVMDSDSWQRAWDKHPKLRARYDDLYRQRGEVQLEQDAIEAKTARAARRRQHSVVKPKSRVAIACPNCSSLHITRDATAAWSTSEQCWVLAGTQDCMTCQDCSREFYDAVEQPL